jgi:hypothetical protein
MQKETFGKMEKKLEEKKDSKERVEVVTQSLSEFYAKMFNDLDARLRKLERKWKTSLYLLFCKACLLRTNIHIDKKEKRDYGWYLHFRGGSTKPRASQAKLLLF